MTRREFLAAAGAAASAQAAAPARPQICVFSKHLAQLDYNQLGQAAHEMGFDGVDLTVRPGGHVAPERVATDLPRAVEAIRSHGVAVPLITTSITSAGDAATRAILSTAGRLKIPYYKLGYWQFGAADPEADIARVRNEVERLVALGRDCGITAGFHNHSGNYVGYEVRDVRTIIAGLDPRAIGFYFDAAHATIEGGLEGWEMAQRIALKQVKLAAMKDFSWEKTSTGWDVRWQPLGRGMVNWRKVLAAYAAAHFAGPMSIHVEYEPEDAIPATRRDLEFLRKQIGEAYRA
ncbi:MAG TPA: sugar phosphate isomerase/epimerase family protein [Bryobacteraceae bacterium]|nr:sugar phosphate isomerase/epimerase family protein [Bryobacteraceae bacterium]